VHAPVSTAGAAAAGQVGSEVEVRPRVLPRGAAPEISWLAANLVHMPDGRVHRFPWTGRAAVSRDLTLRGRTTAGWVVTDHDAGIGTRAWVVDGAERREIDLASDNNDEHTFMVARDGTALLKREFTQDFASVMVTRVSDGATLGSEDFEGDGRVLDFSGAQALLGVDGGSVLWEPGGDTIDVGAVAVAGDIAHDVLVVPGDVAGFVGPTTLSEPGAPAWTAPLERVEVSPDGRFLLGLVTGGDTDGRHIEVRRLSDGRLVSAYHVRNLWRLTMQWESPRSIIFLAARTGLGDVNALVHCGFDGTCTRATAWRELRSISMVHPPQIVRNLS